MKNKKMKKLKNFEKKLMIGFPKKIFKIKKFRLN